MNNTQRNWPFQEPRNIAVITSARIVDKEDWVHYVTHDEDDGSWQFHAFTGPTNEKDAAVISLEHMLRIEPRIEELADLPLGWHAWRDDEGAPWKRAPKQPG